jgi:hypothetical protein
MKAWALVGFSAALIALSGCGGDSKNESAKEFSQNVDRVPYTLTSFEVSTNLGTNKANDAETLHKAINQGGRAKDDIQRVIKGSSFVLVINGNESALQVSSAGNINHQQTVAENTPGCSLSGASKVSGLSSSLNLEITWELNAELKGDACDAAMLEKYFKFQSDELAVFHLNAVNGVLDSADLPKDLQRNIHLAVKVAGDSH